MWRIVSGRTSLTMGSRRNRLWRIVSGMNAMLKGSWRNHLRVIGSWKRDRGAVVIVGWIVVIDSVVVNRSSYWRRGVQLLHWVLWWKLVVRWCAEGLPGAPVP